MNITEEEMETNEDEAEKNTKQGGTNPIIAGEKEHYDTFEFLGESYKLEDTVLLSPDEGQKPDVAIIKEITKGKDGERLLKCQLLYRPEDAVKRKDRSYDARDNRELLHSFKVEVVQGGTLMHKCLVHYVPLNKQLPVRSKYPGFIVQRVYDHTKKKIYRITDKDYDDGKQREIDLLLQKTRERIELIDNEKPASHDIEHRHSKKKQRDVSRASVNPFARSSFQYVNVENTPGSSSDNSYYYTMLENSGAFTGEDTRDKWLIKLLQAIEFICGYTKDGDTKQTEHQGSADGISLEKVSSTIIKYSEAAAVSAVVALEKASHDILSNEFKRYNRKMRQLESNLKNNERLARRMLTRELEAPVIVNMSAEELKKGCLTTEENAARKEPAEKETVYIQMTDYECSRCMEKKVGLKDIMQAGSGQRYQLECTYCGHSWFTSSI